MSPARTPAPAPLTNIPANADFKCHATGIPALQNVLSERAALLSGVRISVVRCVTLHGRYVPSSRKVAIPPSLEQQQRAETENVALYEMWNRFTNSKYVWISGHENLFGEQEK